MPREFKCETASGGVRGIRRRKGAGFSSEIETNFFIFGQDWFISSQGGWLLV